MATITRNPAGVYTVVPGDDLTKIATTQGRTLQELLATNPQFQNNPSLIQPGDIVLPPGGLPQGMYGSNGPGGFNYATPQAAAKVATPPPAPSLPNLTSGAPSGGGFTPTAISSGNATTSFTEALIAMLKEAQARDSAGQAKLMKQSQGITGQGLNDANKNFRNKYLTPSAGTSLGMSAQNQFDPLQLSIANQQKLASQNLNNITDLVRQTGTSYDNEQDRLARAKENALDRASSGSGGKFNFNTEANTSEVAKKMVSIAGPDGYIDPYVWMSMRNLWQSSGGSDSSFVSNFKRFVNPASHGLVGLDTGDGFVPLY